MPVQILWGTLPHPWLVTWQCPPRLLECSQGPRRGGTSPLGHRAATFVSYLAMPPRRLECSRGPRHAGTNPLWHRAAT